MGDGLCLDENNTLDGILCMKSFMHAGTHAHWEEVDDVYTFITWGLHPK